ncbi:MAG: tyrosine-type recombinase/integrase [Brevinema sp.]
MGLLKRNGVYYLEYKDGAKNKRMSLKTKNKDLAQKMYETYLLSQITKKFTSQQNISIIQEPIKNENKEYLRKSILTAFDEYKELCISQNLSQGVIKSKERLNKLFKENKIKYLDDINQKFINEIVNNYQKDTANRYIKNLKAFMNFCIKKRYYDRMEFEGLSFIRQDDNVRDVIIDDKDYKYMRMAVTDKDFLLYIDTLWNTGCRPNEITGLKKSDIDFKNGTVKIFQSKTKKYKTIYLNDELLELYKVIDNEYIFNGYSKQKEYYAKKFRDLRESLNMNKEYCLYAFRHSFGTRMLDKTKDIHLVSKLLGHSNISITAKHYINRSDSEIREKLINS